MGKQHIIELNGKKYDTVTGKMIAETPIHASSTKAPKTTASLDGFAQASKTRASIHHVSAHKAERSKTLMRASVNKPIPTKSKVTKLQSDRIQPSASVIAAHSTPKPVKNIHKSSLVRKFSEMAAAPIQQPTPATTKKPAQTQRLQAVATATTVVTNPVEAGLAKADSHTQPRPKKQRLNLRVAKRLHMKPRTLSTASLLLAGVLVMSFFAYQNAPNLSMRIASARAGIEGSLPGYRPSGFGIQGGIAYKPGQIEVSYGSNTDERSYKITQATSSWNSETLAQNYGPLKENSNYQTIPNKGKTVYVYEGSNATWVDGGIWYRIEGDSKLSSDQLLNVADSL